MQQLSLGLDWEELNKVYEGVNCMKQEELEALLIYTQSRLKIMWKHKLDKQ